VVIALLLFSLVFKDTNNTRQLKVATDAKTRNIDGEISQLKMIIENNRKLSEQFRNLTGISDTSKQQVSSYSEIELNILEKEKKYLFGQYKLELSVENSIHEEEIKSYSMQLALLKKELEALSMDHFKR